MIEMEQTRQADLFDITSGTPRKTSAGSLMDRLRITLRPEHILFIMLGIGMLAVWIYTMGIETGKTRSADTVRKMETEYRAKFQALELRLQSLGPVASEVSAVSEKRSGFSKPNDVSPEIVQAAGKVLSETKDLTAAGQKDLAVVEVQENSLPQGKYTIQLVTYQTEKAANAYIEKLASEGIRGFIIPSGKYFQVCADAFHDKTSARNALDHFRSGGLVPKDAFVRSIAR